MEVSTAFTPIKSIKWKEKMGEDEDGEKTEVILEQNDLSDRHWMDFIKFVPTLLLLPFTIAFQV